MSFKHEEENISIDRMHFKRRSTITEMRLFSSLGGQFQLQILLAGIQNWRTSYVGH